MMNKKELMNELEDQKTLRQPASYGFREWFNEYKKGLRRGINDVATGERQPMEYGYGGFVGTRINNIIYDECFGKDWRPDIMLTHPGEIKELINAAYGLPNATTVERIRELEEQVKILKDLLGLTESQLAHKLIERAVTPNQIRSIIGLDKIETPREATIDDVLKRASVTWYDDPVQNYRVIISRNLDQPLTSDEREMLYKMWFKQKGHFNCVFYEQAEPNGKKKLMDEFPKIEYRRMKLEL